MFNGLRVLVITSPNFTPPQAQTIQETLEREGAREVIIKDQSDTNINYLVEQDDASIPINHIITNTVQFIEYQLAQSSMTPITTPRWIEDCVKAGKVINLKSYNPDPKFFLQNCFVCIADNLPSGDKEVLYAGVRAFGGQYMDDLTKHTTHLIAVDMGNIKSIIAHTATTSSISVSNARAANGANQDDKVDIKIVLPHWLDDCLKQCKKLPEAPYLLTNEKVQSSGKPDYSLASLNGASDGREIIRDDDAVPETNNNKVTKFFEGKRIYLASDYNLSQRMTQCLHQLLELHGGQLVSSPFNVDTIDVYIGQYRSGDEYVASCRSNRIVVSNLQWVYHILLTNNWVLPLNSNLLHYPTPKLPLDDFKGLKISVTNYTGDARFYLTKLITLLGGDFTKTLTRDNDYLIAAKPEGRKYETARHKWKDDNGEPSIKIVNHYWLEECFANWQFMDPNLNHYQFLDNRASMEGSLGRVKLDPVHVKKWYQDDNEITNKANGMASEGNTNVDDSMSEDESPTLSNTQAMANDRSQKHDQAKKTQVSRSESSNHQKSKRSTSAQGSDAADADGAETNTHDDDVDADTSIHVVHENDSSPVLSNITNGRAGRSAKQKAALRLHADMSDLNDYTTMSKSVKKMKSYMKDLEASAEAKSKIRSSEKKSSRASSPSTANSDLEASATPHKRPSSPITSQLEPSTKKSKSASPNASNNSSKTKAKPKTKSSTSDSVSKPSHPIVGIMTGCEQEITLNRADVVKLSRAGVKIVNDYAPKHHINTIIAPRILRTEKFLKSLSVAERIIHPNYLIQAVKKVNTQSEVTWEGLSKEYKVEDFALDKVVPLKEINQELGIDDKDTEGWLQLFKSSQKGHIFSDTKLNLSTNLNGGVSLISSILESHGLTESKSFKSISASSAKQLLKNDNETGDIIFVAHKSKDAKSINALKTIKPEVVIVEWDWCVKSIFRMKLEDFDAYRL